MLVSKVLTDWGALIDQVPLLGSQNQFLRTMLERVILPAPAKDIFIMPDLNDPCFLISCQ